MGLNAKSDDFELYKYYKVNNLNLDDIKKCDLSEKDIIKKEIRVYKNEIKYIIENYPDKFALTYPMFIFLILSKVYSNDKGNTFFASYKMLGSISKMNSSTYNEYVKIFSDYKFIEKLNRLDYYRGMDIDLFKTANVYRVLFINNI